MDLSTENDLVKAVIAGYMKGFDRDGIAHGGIGLDNAGNVPREFLEALARRLNARGLGIAANGCPDQFLSYIDFFGNEGLPFSINYARRARQEGLRGILGEFTMQHLSGGRVARPEPSDGRGSKAPTPFTAVQGVPPIPWTPS
jgi:hypothetical protein